MKIRVIKLISSIMMSFFLLSLTVFPCFAYGDDRDSYNSIIADEVVSNSLNWDVTFNISGNSSSGDNISTNLNFTFDPIIPDEYVGVPNFSSTSSDYASRNYFLDNELADEPFSIDLNSTYTYPSHLNGMVDIVYNWSFNALYTSWNVDAIQFKAHHFYYTYDPTVVSDLDTVSPFHFEFPGATSVTTIVNYHELGNAVDAYSFTFIDDIDDTHLESFLSPDLFGLSDDDSFTFFIDSVVVIPEYDSSVPINSIQLSYVYNGAYCEFSRAADINSHISPPSDAVFADYTSWIGLAVSGFLEFQIFPGFSFGALFMVIVSFSTVMWFLKLFAGG